MFASGPFTSPRFVDGLGWGWGGVGWGNNVRCNCFVTDLLRHFYLLRDNMGMALGWGGVITYVAIASSRSCYATSTGLWWRMASLSLSAATAQESQTQSCGSTSKFNSGAGRWEHASSSQRLDVSSQCCEKDLISIRILFDHKTL